MLRIRQRCNSLLLYRNIKRYVGLSCVSAFVKSGIKTQMMVRVVIRKKKIKLQSN